MRLKAIQLVAIVLAMALVVSLSVAAQQAPAAGAGGQAPRGAGGPGGGGGGQGRGGPAVPGLTLTSTAWPDGGEIPVKYAGAGQSISPQLSWSNAPMGTVEFVLIMNDPEPIAPRGSGSATGDILHWLVAKIPASTTSLPEGAGAAQPQLPAGARQIQAYRGPGAPAVGPPHHYTFTLYALNAALELPATAGRPEVMAAMEGKVLARGIFNGRYKAPQ
jgi:Raf kinase inhibitor-like YbhB/YbcL family protein